MSKKQVPPDLLPMYPRDYNEEWARKTVRYREIFCPYDNNRIPTDEDVISWIRIARDLGEDLKRLGLSRAKKRVVDMMNEFFGKKLNNQLFRNLCDVGKWFAIPNNYHENYQETLDMLHMFQYGIFRNGNNTWALDEAYRWMELRNISYEKKTGVNVRTGKGFVYRLLVSRASDTICNRLQSITRRCHQEYVIVRERTQFQALEGQVLQKHVFNHLYKGAIVRLRKMEETKSKSFSNEEFMELNKLLCKANRKGVTYEELCSVLNNLVDDSEEGKVQ